MAIIDLGDVSSPSLLEISPPARDTPRRRWAQVAALIAIVIATLVASAALPAPPMRLIASIPTDGATVLLVHGRQAIVIDGFADRARIRSYDLDSGTVRWSAPFAGDTASTYVAGTPTTVIASFDADMTDGTAASVAYDLRSGRQLWRQPGFAGDVLHDGGVIMTDVPEAIAGTRVGSGDIKVVEQTTGAVRWQEPVGVDCQVTMSDDSAAPRSSVIELCLNSGVMTVRDVATGALRAERAVRSPSTSGASEQVAIIAIGDLTIVEDFEALDTIVNAYHTGDATLVWSHRTWPNVYYYPCDIHLCQNGDAPSSNAVIDPRTGDVIPGLSVPVPPDDPPPTFGSGLSSTMLDILPDANARPIPAPGFFISYTGSLPADLGVDVPVGLAGTTWVVRQEGGVLRPIQKLPGVIAQACVAVTTYVACSKPDKHLVIWHLP